MLSAVRSFLIQSALIMRWLTWPGSFFHELAHQLACYVAGHEVLEVRYIIRNDPNNVAGYVRHRGPPGVGRELFIGIAPLFLGFMVWAIYIGLAALLTSDGSLGLVDAKEAARIQSDLPRHGNVARCYRMAYVICNPTVTSTSGSASNGTRFGYGAVD